MGSKEVGMLKLVLSGYYGFDNVGDEAILYAIIHALRKEQPDVDITVLSNQPTKTAKTYKVNAVNRWKLQEVHEVIKNADGLISGGGSLLQDQTSWKTIPYYLAVMGMAKASGTPFFVYAQGMGPVRQPQNKLMMKWVLKHASLVAVRDQDSKNLLTKLGIKKDISIVPDPVLGINPSGFTNLFKVKKVKKVIAVSVRDWANSKAFMPKLAEALDRLAAENNTIVLVPMHGKHDDETSQELRSKMKNQNFVHISPYDASIENKMAVIRDADLLIGMRLHALIFAAAGNTPFIALSYDPKIDAFAQLADQPVIGHVEQNDWTADDLYREANEQLESIKDRAAHLQATVAPHIERANDTARQVIDYIQTH
ncbi:polysaccharide pyruvyl transferase CsaB [Chryseomicrobium excrementi]|uniref:Polysaccharide pyruvyl transferase CsaB n=2 Tax=Chryseomicrobium excrementi TaxID=2041346 RepID=A0A2M9F0A3_9BACL|nr:polysaccharide pyruvyl transferase CsaB [Chryseomicrobium excrementi]